MTQKDLVRRAVANLTAHLSSARASGVFTRISILIPTMTLRGKPLP